MPESLPFASVVVPVCNEEARIGPCIESLLRLDYPRERYEVIVVENGSADGTARVLDRYADRIRVLGRGRANRSAARNAGLDAASGEVVAFVDGDCVAEPGWLRAIVEPLATGTRVVVAGEVLAPPGAGWVERFADRVHDQRAAVGYDPPYASTASCSMPLAPLRETAAFDVDVVRNEDVDLSYRLYDEGWSFVHQPMAVVYHRGAESLWRLFRLGFRHGHHSIRALNRHAPLLQRLGHPRWSWAPYRHVARAFAGLLCAPSRGGLCELVFVTGNVAGKLTGGVRFRHLAS